MKKTIVITLCALTLIITSLVWWFSDTQVIKRQTHELAHVLSVDRSDGKTRRAHKNQRFANLLAASASCRVDTPHYQTELHHTDLVSAHHMLVHSCQSSSATPTDIHISTPDRHRSTVTADLDLTVTEKEGTRHHETCRAVLLWQKNAQGQWKLHTIDVIAR
ncbi:MAG: hypothetical protein KJO21_09910 [Verrucomicrobiae bacterium]|nr:hypothetical protein [Verrucomicrobiae bacterium]NNJ43773.1 hypothetical protein [Akkermansiaceae bacterium]